MTTNFSNTLLNKPSDPTSSADRAPREGFLATRSIEDHERPERCVTRDIHGTLSNGQVRVPDKAAILRGLKRGPVFGVSNLIKRVAGVAQDLQDAQFSMRMLGAIRELIDCGAVACEKHGGTVLLTLTQEGYRQERAARALKAVHSSSSTHPDKSIVLRILKDGPVFGGSTLVKRVAVSGGFAVDRDFKIRVATAVQELRKSGAVFCFKHGGTVRLALTQRGRRQLLAPHLEPRIGTTWRCVVAGTAALAVGCASIEPDVPRVPLMGYPTPVGMQQVRDGNGQVFFAPCNPCAAPSPKTSSLSEHNMNPAAEPAARPPGAMIMAKFEPLQRPTTAKTPLRTSDKLTPTGSPVTIGELGAQPMEPALTVRFRSGQSTLTSEGRKAIAALASTAKAAARVHVRGATDSQGGARVNQALAAARAAAVRAELLANEVPAEKIKTSHCTSCFVAANDTAAGRQANRRADIDLSELPTNALARI